MAFSTILRRTVSSVVPLTIRSTGAKKSNYSAIFSPSKNNGLSYELHTRTFLSSLNFSSPSKKSNSDQHLLGIIDTEIKCAEEELEDHSQLDEIPDGFPFEIQDEPGTNNISLVRQYRDEDILIIVRIPELVDSKDNDEEENEENSEMDGVNLVVMGVRVIKGKNQPHLLFGCAAYRHEIAIRYVHVIDPDTSTDVHSYEGPDILTLDKNLQKCLYKYLEDRGIKPSTTNFLYQYLIKKDSKEYLKWLKNLKNIIEK